MRRRGSQWSVAFAGIMVLATSVFAEDIVWLTWSARQAEAAGRAWYAQGRVGGFWDLRGLKTEHSYNYKLAATWMTREAVQATARLIQITERLDEPAARRLVSEAEDAGGIVVMVEIDPREGSGVIPSDWAAFLQPVSASGTRGAPVRGSERPALRDVRGLSSVLRRNYDYDRFWWRSPCTTRRADASSQTMRSAPSWSCGFTTRRVVWTGRFPHPYAAVRESKRFGSEGAACHDRVAAWRCAGYPRGG